MEVPPNISSGDVERASRPSISKVRDGGKVRNRTVSEAYCERIPMGEMSLYVENEGKILSRSPRPSLKADNKNHRKVSRHYSDVSGLRKSRFNRTHRKHAPWIKPGARRESVDQNQTRSKNSPTERSDVDLASKDIEECPPERKESAAPVDSSSVENLTKSDAPLPERRRKRRFVVMIVVMTCLFLVAFSIFVVVLTLTHSAFNKNQSASSKDKY